MFVKIRLNPEKDLLTIEVPEKRKLNLKILEDLSPLELLLASLGACAIITAYKSLTLRGGNIKHIEITLTKKSAENDKNSINEVTLYYDIKACNVGVKEAEEVIKSSLQRECVIANILTRGLKSNPIIKLRKVRSKSRYR